MSVKVGVTTSTCMHVPGRMMHAFMSFCRALNDLFLSLTSSL